MFILNRIIHLNFHNFFKVYKNIKKKSSKGNLYLFLDIIYCGIIYKAGYNDYYLFEMYNLTNDERKNIITRGFNNSLVKKLNNPNFNHFFSNKNEFNDYFNKYLNRDYLYLNNEEDFYSFANKHHIVIAKPLNLSCGKNIKKINIFPNEKSYNYLLNNQLMLLEEVIKQHNKINEIYPFSTNSIRIVTINHHVIFARFRIGNGENIVDNFNHGGMVCNVDINSGKVISPAVDKNGNLFYRHPVTNKEIFGFNIPKWNEIISLCEKISYLIPEIKYVGWDIAVGNDKLYVIEGNEYPGHDIYELPALRNGKIGNKDLIIKFID
jgi:glutathione synthase/RimK-type ligase-like ATP-grasp enzyme